PVRGRVRGGQRVRGDEARLPLATAPEARLDRVAGLGEVVAVEVEADLEPEGVACAETGGAGTVLRERVPYGGGAVGRDQQLHAVLAGVARAGHEALDARDGGLLD